MRIIVIGFLFMYSSIGVSQFSTHFQVQSGILYLSTNYDDFSLFEPENIQPLQNNSFPLLIGYLGFGNNLALNDFSISSNYSFGFRGYAYRVNAYWDKTDVLFKSRTLEFVHTLLVKTPLISDIKNSTTSASFNIGVENAFSLARKSAIDGETIFQSNVVKLKIHSIGLLLGLSYDAEKFTILVSHNYDFSNLIEEIITTTKMRKWGVTYLYHL